MVNKRKATTKDSKISVRVGDALRDALQRAADEDQRNISSLILKILSDWTAARGYLKPK